ncbi:MAG TPA: hypothetical protein DCE44_22670 [Verrucomicrobiales bacterium]|nr:hypothetical protein [Verrucomicrobiales bacterium]
MEVVVDSRRLNQDPRAQRNNNADGHKRADDAHFRPRCGSPPDPEKDCKPRPPNHVVWVQQLTAIITCLLSVHRPRLTLSVRRTLWLKFRLGRRPGCKNGWDCAE